MKQKLILLLIVLLCLSAGTYAQSDSVCYGHTSTAPSCADSFVTNYPGGSWASSDTTVAVVNPETGEVTPVSGGTTDIEYTFANGCGKYHYSYTVTIIKPTLTGTDSICVGSTTTFVASPSGGTWVSGNTAVATVGTTGVVTGVAAGSSIITYTSPQGCESTKAVYVSAPFSVAICETAPIAICDSVVTYCTGLTLKVSGAPAGAAYSWSGSIPATLSYDGSDAVFTFTASPTAGYYTVTATYGGCSATQRIRILVATGSCEPCSAFKPACSGCDTVLPFITLRTSTLTSANVSTTTPQNYFIASPGGNVRLNVSPAPGSVFYVDKGVQMYIELGDSVMLDSCHLFATSSCMWNGIEIKVSSTQCGQVYLKNNSMIEHVNSVSNSSGGAITVHNYTWSPVGNGKPLSGANIIDIEESILNTDKIGVNVVRYAADTLPFRVVKSIVSNRNYCSYRNYQISGCKSYYPYSWPTVDYLAQVDSGATGYYPKYRLDSFGLVGSVSVSGGLIFSYSGKRSNGQYRYITIGDSTNPLNQNIFDNNGSSLSQTLGGVLGPYSTIRVFNSTFRHCSSGIYVGGTTIDTAACQVRQGNTPDIVNRFYDCNTAVYCSNVKAAVICKNRMYGMNNSISTYADKAVYVYNTSVGIDTVSVDSNEIKNYYYGIFLKNSTSINKGKWIVTRNTIQGISAAGGTEYVKQGIAVSHVPSTDSTGTVVIKNNYVVGFREKGILCTDATPATIDNNVVVIRSNGAGIPSQATGIDIDRSSNPICIGVPANRVVSVSYNQVYGDTTSGVTYDNSEMSYSTASRTYDGFKGLQFQRSGLNTKHVDVLYNNVHDLGIGFNFEDTNYVNWSSNTMSRLQIGMALQSRYCSGTLYRALIGLQGDTCTPSDNIWIADSTSWPGWGHTNVSGDTIWQTFVSNDTPAVNTSILFVRDSVATKPTANGSNNDSSYAFSFADGTLVLAHNCTGSRMSTSSSGSDMPLMQAAEANSYRLYPNPNDGRFTVQRTEATDEAVMAEVVNMTGQKVFEGSLNFRKGQASLDLQKRAPGVYLLRMVKSKGSVETLRFVVD